MAQKTVKKTTAKAATVKKAPVKKAATKPAAKKVVKATKPAAEKIEFAPVNGCGCGEKCPCAQKRCTFGRVIKKLIIALIIFALGFAAAKMCCCHKGFKRAPRVNFVEGCLDVSSVKCPKLQAALPAMDINQDGCITRDEFRAVKKEMRREIREMQVEIAE